MNLLCPNCQKMLTVPEQYAGQLMKCPLCAGTFTVPNMPAIVDPGPAFAPPPPPPPSSTAPPPQNQDHYILRNDPEPAFNPAPAFDPLPQVLGAPPEPAFTSGPPSSAPPPPPQGSNYTGYTGGPSASTSPEGYTRTCSLPFSPQVLRWVPPAALMLIFILQFFPWVGIYPGGVAAVTQTAWGAAFGGYTEDPDMRKEFGYPTDEELEKRNKNRDSDKKIADPRPGVSLLVLFYLLLFIPALLVTLGSVALLFIKTTLPPAVQQLLPWQWAIQAGLNAVLLLFLFLQLLLNFSLENSFKDFVDSRIDKKKLEKANTQERKMSEANRGIEVGMLERTTWLKLAVFLQLVTTIAAALVLWVEKRHPSQPVPKLELLW